MGELLEEIVLEGAPISGGVAIGKLFFLEALQEEIVPEFSIPLTGIEKEVGRYRRAVLSSREDLHDLQRFLAKEGSAEAVSIIDTHIQMLEDPFMTTFMEKKIRQRMKNTEAVFRAVMNDYEKEFSKMSDGFFKQRLLDVKDLSQRILRNLHPTKSLQTETIPKDSIIFTKELIPSSSAEATKGQVKGFITEIGGATSHAALIARSKGIPYVVNISIDTLYPYKRSPVIIDGKTGTVIVNPTPATLKTYEEKLQSKASKQTSSSVEKREGASTKEGEKITLLANIENFSDLDLLSPYQAEGIGLFRSEFLFFGKELQNFSEEDQFIIYQKVMEKGQGMPIIFRTFDVGGDKGNVNQYEEEPNPSLGCRGIRFLLRSPEIFTQQLRALLRVSPDGDLHILLPMISDLTELLEAKELIQEVALKLHTEGYEIAEEIPIGCMIEVPSAVMVCDHIARECDFLSIGTNDLVQYTLAADRAMQKVYPFYKPLHLSIIRMLKTVVESGKQANIPVSICGEMASDPLMAPILIGLGVRRLSCAPRFIPQVRRMVNNLSISEIEEMTQKALELESGEAIEALLRESFGSTMLHSE